LSCNIGEIVTIDCFSGATFV